MPGRVKYLAPRVVPLGSHSSFGSIRSVRFSFGLVYQFVPLPQMIDLICLLLPFLLSCVNSTCFIEYGTHSTTTIERSRLSYDEKPCLCSMAHTHSIDIRLFPYCRVSSNNSESNYYTRGITLSYRHSTFVSHHIIRYYYSIFGSPFNSLFRISFFPSFYW